jgi:hypothetical protein
MARIKKSMISAGLGHQTNMHTNLDTGEITVHTRQDTEGIIETVKHARDNLKDIGVGKAMSKGAALMPLAEIPMIEWNKACKLNEENNPEYWKRWLKQPENSMFKIYDGRH